MGTKELGQLTEGGGDASGPMSNEGVDIWTPLVGVLVNNSRTKAAHEIIQQQLQVDGHVFHVQLIRWENRPLGEESQLHLLNARRMAVFSVKSPIPSRPGFHTWTFISSAWADTDLCTLDAPTWHRLLDELSRFAAAIYAAFIGKRAESAVQRFEREGYFPSYADLDEIERAWRLQHAREMVRQTYIADPRLFDGGSEKQTKVLIRLLDRLAVSSENDALVDVLNGALELDPAATARLAGHLRRSSMENIAASIDVLQRRELAVQKLRHLMTEHYRDVLELPDLQRIIENNTWLFGPRYETLGAEDDSFTKIARSIRDRVVGLREPAEEDVDCADDLHAARRQPDLFLARKFPAVDSLGRQIYKFIVIEMKRPAISLNKKHLRQLEDYAEIIKSMAEFDSELMHFELILVGRRISSKDSRIRSRLHGNVVRGDLGLIEDNPNMKLYVMNWTSLLASFELTHHFMLEKLKLKRAELVGRTKGELVAELQEVH